MKTKEELIHLGIEKFKADEIMLLQEKMLERAVKFQFRKKDGTIRNAIGTLKRELMVLPNGKLWEPSGESSQSEHQGVVNFFDTEKQTWRCFTPSSFIGLAQEV